MNIATGTPEDHPTPLPVDASGLPGVAPPTAIASGAAVQGGVRDLTGERLSQLAAAEAQIAGAQSAGMAAELGRRDGYHADMIQLGGPTAMRWRCRTTSFRRRTRRCMRIAAMSRWAENVPVNAERR
jgi:hypothetical protein